MGVFRILLFQRQIARSFEIVLGQMDHDANIFMGKNIDRQIEMLPYPFSISVA